MLDRLQGSDVLRFLATLWGLWKVRNDMVLDSGSPNVEVTVLCFINLLQEHHVYARNVTPRRSSALSLVSLSG